MSLEGAREHIMVFSSTSTMNSLSPFVFFIKEFIHLFILVFSNLLNVRKTFHSSIKFPHFDFSDFSALS